MHYSRVPDTPFVLGAKVPRRGNWFSRGLAGLILRVCGWRLVGATPDAPKFVMTAAPHTSNMDGLLLLIAAFAMGLDQHWILKHTLFKGIWGPIFRWTGAISVNRKQAGGMVQQVLHEFEHRAQFVVIVSPEGTRNHTETWKSGFHRIATRAQVPVCLGFIDYKLRRVGFGPSFTPSADFRKDLATMSGFYRLITPRHPALFALPTALRD